MRQPLPVREISLLLRVSSRRHIWQRPASVACPASGRSPELKEVRQIEEYGHMLEPFEFQCVLHMHSCLQQLMQRDAQKIVARCPPESSGRRIIKAALVGLPQLLWCQGLALQRLVLRTAMLGCQGPRVISQPLLKRLPARAFAALLCLTFC